MRKADQNTDPPAEIWNLSPSHDDLSRPRATPDAIQSARRDPDVGSSMRRKVAGIGLPQWFDADIRIRSPRGRERMVESKKH
jgi:hypothetical protein